ncbi:MAG: alpha/beta hydrolase [Halobacteriovoraceae bacterium]|nr:alpha/beta hydrolase [Halobacteriovoraceae bacterium]|tara:strand:+ start:22797 stop:23639 length:843 start_codon:yes stop_codon:yes gene_type:complete
MRIDKYGAGPKTIVLIHGGPSLFGYMKSLGKHLAPSYKVIDYAQKGTYESPGSSNDLSIDSHIDDLVEVVKSNSSEDKVVLLGHSWGASLSLLTAAQHPDLVEKVIVMGTAPLEEKTADAFSENLNRKFPKSVKAKLEKIDRELELAKTDQDKNTLMQDRLRLIGPYYHLNPKTEEFMPSLKWNYITFLNSIDSLWKKIDAGEIPSLLQRVKSPVVAFHGDSDPIPHQETFKFLKRNIGNLKTIKVEHAGHFPWLEETSKERFLKDLFLELKYKKPLIKV